MIKTARQLKDKIRNLSGGDSKKAQSFIRNYIMEEFLLRLSLSEYKDRFILKGGMLVSSLAGINSRATMDIDTTVKAVSLNLQEATKAIETICAVPVDDNISFHITAGTDIMEEHDYPGIRFSLEAKFDSLIQPVKIDISTGDIITPSAIEYSYKMMFEEKSIRLMTYNIETLLAEKFETVLSRSTENTRMRDFYDIVIISGTTNYDNQILKKAFLRTAAKRDTEKYIDSSSSTFEEIKNSETMKNLWYSFIRNNWYVDNISWEDAINTITELFNQFYN